MSGAVSGEVVFVLRLLDSVFERWRQARYRGIGRQGGGAASGGFGVGSLAASSPSLVLLGVSV